MEKNRVAAALGRRSRLAVAILVALAGTQSAVQGQGDEPEEVVVTGTRIRATGIDMPNPVTVVTRDELSIIAPTNMIEGLAELPQFYGSSTTQNPGGFFTTTGAGSLNLRGLQSKRTLQLLDGRRVVPSTIFGGPDINLFPENVVRTVETVTGGATAAYGTDAVAGAVNFILDTDYEGIRANVSTGANENSDNEHYEVSFGAGFALGDSSHLLVSAEKSEQDALWGSQILDYDWYAARALLENPDTANRGLTPGNPFFLPASDVYSMNYSLDGIFHLPASAGGSQILDANGSPSPFVLGSLCNAHGCSTTNGGSGIESGIQTYAVTPDSGRENLFTYFEHRFASNVTVFGQLLYGEAEFTQRNFGGLFPNPPGAPFDRAFTIFSGNPFLPPAIQQAMTANGVNSVQFSRIGAEEDLAFDAYTQQITETTSLTGGVEYEFAGGGFFNDWQLRGYYQQGETDVEAIQRGGIRLDRVYLAADVVTNPATGQPACHVTVVSGLYPDCVPLNLFGRGRASAAAIDWVTGFEPGVPMQANGFLSATESLAHSYTSTENKQRVIAIEQTVWEASMDGELAEGWAGPITMAFGGGLREESFTQVVEVGPGGNVNADPTFRPVRADNPALGIRGVPGGNAASGNSVEVQFSNVPFARGDQDVAEVFTELLIPLVRERTGVQQLNFNGAARWADYSGSGQVQSWKGGFDWAIVEQLRLRTTVSEDVRAATMGEKFDRTGGIGTITDYLLNAAGTVSYGVTTFSNGTPDIKPEQAKTKTVGFVYVPARLEDLSFSLDWYNVDVADNINQITANQVAQGCYQQGNVDLCQFITRGGAPSDENPAINYISLVGIPYYNQASVTAQGVDFELNYARALDWFGGGERLGLRLLGSFLNERSDTNSVGLKTYTNGGFGLPEWTALVAANYSRGPLSLALTTRYTDSMAVNLNWNFMGTSTRWDVYDNEISSEVVSDLRFNYNFDTRSGRIGLFVNVNNVFGMDAEEFLNAAFSSNFSAGTGLGVTGEGDRGRRFTVGVRMDF